MKITWEDRKGRGQVDGHTITEKPVFSFEYAWFLVTDDKAQYVESHEYGYWNKDMTTEQRQEVVDFYVAWEPPVEPEPTLEEIKEANANTAKTMQNGTLTILLRNDLKKSLGLPPEISEVDEAALKEYTKRIQADIDNPPGIQAYNPPLPPGVIPPSVDSILITITREPGWQGNIGWRAVITSGEEKFIPANLAIAEYSNPNCDGYLYTTGAFQQDGDTWFAQCPPGQEKGNVDVHLGLLYGAAQLSCFTFKAGNQEQLVYAYEEV
jgi:hypothetical protein